MKSITNINFQSISLKWCRLTIAVLLCTTFKFESSGQFCATPTATFGISPTTSIQTTPSYSSGVICFTFNAVQGCSYWFNMCGLTTYSTSRGYIFNSSNQYLANFNTNCSGFTWTSTTTGVHSVLLVEFGCNPLVGNTAFSYSSVCTGANCSGTPPTPTATTSTLTGCPNTNFTLTASGLPVTVGNTIQWEVGSSSTGTFASIPGGTISPFVSSSSVTAYYRIVSTCTASVLSATSNVVTFSVVDPGSCYCLSYQYVSLNTFGINITSVQMGGMTNTSVCNGGGPGPGSNTRYGNYAGYVNPPTGCQGAAVPYTISLSDCGNWMGARIAIYIDYNQNGVFTNTGELVYSNTSYSASVNTYTGSIVIPSTATPGITRMRIVVNESTGGIPPSWGTYPSGEVEDYCIEILPQPTISAVAGGSVCPGTAFVITPTGAATYTYVGPGTNLSGASATIHPFSSSNYSIIGSNSVGCLPTGSNMAVVSLTALPAPSLSIISSTSAICSGGSASLSVSGASSYTWVSPNSNSATIVVSPTTTTIYTVFGTGTTACNGATIVPLTVFSIPTITVSPPSATACALTSLNFTASGASTYTWNASVTGAAVTLTTPGSSSVYAVWGTSTAGCVGQTIVPITSKAVPSLTLTPPNPSICANSSITLTATGADVYVWSNNAVGPLLIATIPTTTTFYVSGTNSLNCASTKYVVVTTHTLPIVSVVPTSSTTCQGYTVPFTANGGTTYTWSTGAQGSNVFLTPYANTVYTVVGTNPAGCISSAVATLIANPSPTITLVPLSATVCPSTSVALSVSGAFSYSWSTGDIANSIVVSPSVTTTYTATGTGTNMCRSSKQAVVSTYPSSLVVTPQSATICAGESATFTASGANTYTWFPTLTNVNVFVSDTSSDEYYVTSTDYYLCVSKMSFSLLVDECLGITNRSTHNADISIVPNPSQGKFEIQMRIDGSKEISVINSAGIVVALLKTEKRTETIDLSEYSRGLYFARILFEGRIITRRILLE